MSRRGYTLVEVVVALALTAVVMTALAGTVTTSLRARRAGTATLGRVAAARSVLLHLERELAAALPEGFEVSATPSTLRFTGGADPGMRLTYAVRDGALVRQVEPRFPALDEPPGPPRTVVAGVTALDVRALDGEEWKAAWSGREPPRGVRIALTLDDGEVLEIAAPIPTGRGRAAT